MGETLHIYPTRLKSEVELVNRFTRASAPVLFTGSIVSFTAFEQLLAEELDPSPPLGEIQRWLFLHEAVMVASSGNLRMAGIAETEGFVRSVGELIQQLKLGLVKAGDLERVAGFAPGKEEWLKRVFSGYEGRLRRFHMRDSADVIRGVLGKLERTTVAPACVARFVSIHIHDVYNFTPARFELVRLLGRMKPVTLHFPLPDDRRRVFDFVERDIQKFQDLGEEAGNIELAFEEGDAEAVPLAQFSSSLFAEKRPVPVANLSGQLEILKNSGRYREIEEVAERILLLKGGCEWSDFCLVFRDLEKYGGIVEEVFRRAGIPLYLRRGVPVRSNPWVKTILGIFDAVESGYDRDEVAKIAASRYFSFLPSDIEPHEVHGMLAEAGIIAGPPKYWKERLGGKRSPREAGLARRVLKLVALLEKLERAIRAGASLNAFIDVVNFLKPREIIAESPFSLRDAFSEGRYQEILGEIKEGMAKTGMWDSPMEWRGLRRLFLYALGNTLPPDWSSRNHVYALNIHELAGCEFDVVFICGLHDGEFPRSLQRGSILTETEKLEFNKRHADVLLAGMPGLKRGRAVFSRLGETWEEESFLFYLGTRAARSRLYLTFSMNDLAGKELLPSPFIEETIAVSDKPREVPTSPVALKKEFHEQLDLTAFESRLLLDLFTYPGERAGELLPHFAFRADDRRFMLACHKIRMELDRVHFYGEYEESRRSAESTRFTGKLAGGSLPSLAAYFGGVVKRTYSATALELYAKCPFRFFMDRVLECGPLPLPAPELERTVEGKIIHAVLKQYFDSPPLSKGGHLSREERRELLERIAGTVASEFRRENREGEPKLWELSVRQAVTSLELYLEEEGRLLGEEPFEVVGTEFPFGGDRRKVGIGGEGNRVEFRGSIDRIDHLPRSGKLRVIDYKYSASVTRFNKLLRPETFCVESFQVPIYLYAALNIFAGRLKGLQGGYAAYVTLKKEPQATRLVESPFDSAGDAASLEALGCSADFGGRILGMVGRIESGDFSVTPTDCTFCPHLRACRYMEVRRVVSGE